MPRKDTIKAMVLPGPGAPLRLEVVPVPKIGPNDVLLRVRATGVGLTVVIMTAVPGRVTSFPRIPGHEVAGEVVEIGAEVSHVKVGERVTCHFYLTCRTCRFCRSGRETLCLGSPEPLTAEAHRLGIKVMALCGNVKQARDHARSGVDVVIAQGHEAGGHTGRVTGMVLVPAVVDAVAPVPVLAAGGIADGRGLVAALALGAVGVWMGTRFIATREAYAHANYKDKIVAIDEEGTVVSRASSGKPCRLIRNTFTRSWEGREAEIQPFPVQFERVGRPSAIRAREQGDVENGSAACGQSAGLIRDVRPAGDIVKALVTEAEAALLCLNLK